MNIVFFNPYEFRTQPTGASRRIDFYSFGLNQNQVSNQVIMKDEILSLPFGFFTRVPLFNRLYFFFVIYLLSKKNIVITEVIIAPVWMQNVWLVVHDLKAFTSEAQRGIGKKYLYKIFLSVAKNITVVSNFTKKQIIEFCNIDVKNIHVLPNGISSKVIDLISNTEVSNKYDFVYLSSLARHKNHIGLINALPLNSSLLIIGKDFGSLSSIKQALAFRSDIRCNILTNVSDDELWTRVKSAKVGVFPSLYEGFGIPILEYSAAGLIVVASSIEPFIELTDFVDFYHAPDDNVSLNEALSNSLNLSKINTRDLKLYSENYLAKQLINIINTVSLKKGY